MLVILKKGNKLEKVDKIHLQEGHKPTVDGKVTISDDEQNSLYIESVLWFKTYMVSAIYIDCDRRNILWYRKDIDSFEWTNSKPILKFKSSDSSISSEIADELLMPPELDVFDGQQLFEDIHIYDFDPTVDELMDRSIDVMDSYANKKIDRDSFTLEVIRIIHCYVLPAIGFTTRDTENLNDAANRVMSLLQIIEDKIISKGKSVDLSSTTLVKQRKRLLGNEQFHSETYVRTCDKKFLSFLLLHVEKDILNLDSSLILRQQEINMVREGKSTSNMTSKEAIEKLQALRVERDEIHGSLEKLQVVRENIKNVIKRHNGHKIPRKKIKIQHNVFHEVYRELSVRLQEQKEELHKLVIQKIKITAVREAIRNSLKDLSREGTTPVQVRTAYTDGSEYSINMDGVDGKPSHWMTNDDKVRNQLENCDALRCLHMEGAALISGKIDAIRSELSQFGHRIGMGDDLSGTPRVSSIIFEPDNISNMSRISDSSFDSGSMSISEEDSLFIRNVGDNTRKRRTEVKSLSVSMCEELSELSTSSVKPAMNDIVQDFHKHIEKMCLQFQTVPEIGMQNVNKLWVSYEAIFCNEVLEKFMNMYFDVYKKTCQTLHRGLVTVSLNQLIIDDSFFKALMHQSLESLAEFDDSMASSTEVKLELTDSDFDVTSVGSTVKSFEISKMNVQDLYSMADEECEKTVDDAHNVLDPSCYASTFSIESLTSKETVACSRKGLNQSPEASRVSSQSVEKCYKDALEKVLSPTKGFLKKVLEGKSILEKLRNITKAFRSLNDQLAKLYHQSSACCDDLIAITTALILDLDGDEFTRLYAVINLLIDLRPQFLSGGVHDYSLTTFFSSYQYLFDKQVLERQEMKDVHGIDNLTN